MEEKLEKAHRILNSIRQQAEQHEGRVIIKPQSAEWDAIFLAELVLQRISQVALAVDIIHTF